MGLVSTKKLSEVEKITVSAFCRRRLPVVLVRLKFAETLKEAITFVEQGRKEAKTQKHKTKQKKKNKNKRKNKKKQKTKKQKNKKTKKQKNKKTKTLK